MTVASACHQDQKPTLFTAIPASASGISFANQIEENIDYNILTYEYLYNGGGVAAGDLNNDGLTDLVFTGNMVSNKVYLNQGNLQFRDITEASGLVGRDRWKTGVVMADVNGDGLLDVYVCYSGPGTDEARANELYINQGVKDGVPHFVESAKAYGLDAPGTYTTTASFFDMDNDGDLDAFLVNHADMFFNPFYNTKKLRSTRHPKFGNRLYRNDNGHFTDVSDTAGIIGNALNFGLSVATSDINNDGWTDIYVTNDYDEQDFLYLNNHNGTFREVMATASAHISEFAMGSDIADINNDNRPDIMALDMLPEDNHRQKLLKGPDTYDKYQLRANNGYHRQQMHNSLQLNRGNDSSGAPVFSEIAQMAGVAGTDWSWAPLFEDVDNDGWKDLFISNGILRDITNLDFVKYTSGYTSENTNNKDINDKDKMWKLIKEMPSTKLTSYFYRNKGDLSFANMTSDWGLNQPSVTNGAAYADLDNDGDLDLILNRLNDVAAIYRNNLNTDSLPHHFLNIRLAGAGKNTQGIGARLMVWSGGLQQTKEQFLTRGFQSSVDPVLHFGLGASNNIDSLRVQWPSGLVTRLLHLPADTLLVIHEKSAAAAPAIKELNVMPNRFEEITLQSGIRFEQQLSNFVDFKVSPLLPYQVSKIGPALAKGDVNGDGREDLFIGSGGGKESQLYLQTANGSFIPAPANPWNENKEPTISDAQFFDADQDGDLDLYLVSGGADLYWHHKQYQDRLFENDGKGNFKLIADALPKEAESGACVRVADINHDGKLDCFVGNKLQPGLYPTPPPSYILLNNSQPGAIKFTLDGASQQLLGAIGMVNDASFTDLNQDGWMDLVIAGEFMPVKILENKGGRFEDQTATYGLANSNGWWLRLLVIDVNQDQRPDILAGNLGANLPFSASEKEPVQITYGDLTGNGTVIPVLTTYNKGQAYPFYSRDEMIDQIPALNKHFLNYGDYADAQLKDLFSKDQLAKAKTATINTLQSALMLQSATGFGSSALPRMAQLSAVTGIVSTDINQDGLPDLILAGNYYPFRVQIGPVDAGIGLLLLNKGKGEFQVVDYPQSHLLIRGDVRNMITLQAGRDQLLVVAKCNAPVQVIRIKTG